MADTHNPLDNNVKLYNGWRIPIREIYYSGGILVILVGLVGAWYSVVSKQDLVLYRLDQIQSKQSRRDIAITTLAARVNLSDIERGKIFTQLENISEVLRNQDLREGRRGGG